ASWLHLMLHIFPHPQRAPYPQHASLPSLPSLPLPSIITAVIPIPCTTGSPPGMSCGTVTPLIQSPANQLPTSHQEGNSTKMSPVQTDPPSLAITDCIVSYHKAWCRPGWTRY